MSLFPAFIKLKGRPCLVVGAGPIGESKVASLLAAGAVAPHATAAVSKWAAQGRVSWEAREFQPGDLDGMVLVVSAASSPAVSAAVFKEARSRGVLCNAVDDPGHCDFYYAAIVNRGQLQIAISTGGQSPALAQRLRKELEQQFGPEYEPWIEKLGDARRELFAGQVEPEGRRERLHEIASAGAFEEFQSGAEPRDARGGQTTGTVYLVGAGPGDPELLTLKALRILGQADVVLHDDLLTPEILELIPQTARVECVGKRHGARQVSQEEINARLCRYAAQGLTVVRLKGGDGAIFGRAGEETAALRAAGIPCAMIPGVTAASSAASAAGVSLTDRRLGSALVFLTAQRCKGNPPPNWKAVAALGGALAIYMPGGHETDLARQLIESGIKPDAPCIVVSQASRPDEQILRTTVGKLQETAALPAPAILLIGVLAPTEADPPSPAPSRVEGLSASAGRQGPVSPLPKFMNE
jgi:uroporphyrin-III C-methyltransferase/precorrin-2 dehydrogenase/sirohydrochlorin ferrochelatase